MKIHVPLAVNYGPPIEVYAEIVDVPHLADIATFVVHQNESGNWQLTNVETGKRAGDYKPTKQAAIEAIKYRTRLEIYAGYYIYQQEQEWEGEQ